VYDAAGQRVRKVTDRADGRRKCERIYLGSLELYREYGTDLDDVRLERETLEVADDIGPVARVDTRTRGNDGVPLDRLVRYQFENGNNSAVLEADENGAVISYEEFYPYGSTSYQAGRNAAEVKLKRYRYASMERDEESGLARHGVRYYAPWLGRWISPDPVGIAGGHNLYCYAACDPVNLIDAEGQQPKRNAFQRFLDNRRSGRAYEKAWERYFAHHMDTKLVIRQSTWKALGRRGNWVTKYFLGGARKPDLGIVMKSGLTIAFETGSPPSFEGGYMSTKQRQLRQDAEAIKQGYRLGGGDQKLITPTESRIGRGLPVLGPEGNTPDSNRARYEAKLKAEGKSIPVPPKPPPTKAEIAAAEAAASRKAAIKGKVLTGASVVAFLALSSGSMQDKLQGLAVGYGLNVAQDAFAARVIGAAGARALSLPLSIIIGMCSDQAGSCERQERAKMIREAEEESRDRIIGRAQRIFLESVMKGEDPDPQIVMNMALREEYIYLGGDKLDEAERRRKLAADPNSCSIYSAPKVDFNVRYVGPPQTSMSAR
jgi:RHS repeat-associated protein